MVVNAKILLEYHAGIKHLHVAFEQPVAIYNICDTVHPELKLIGSAFALFVCAKIRSANRTRYI